MRRSLAEEGVSIGIKTKLPKLSADKQRSTCVAFVRLSKSRFAGAKVYDRWSSHPHDHTMDSTSIGLIEQLIAGDQRSSHVSQ
jgi:hypothetical protein